jgi:hypothetical protein
MERKTLSGKVAAKSRCEIGSASRSLAANHLIWLVTRTHGRPQAAVWKKGRSFHENGTVHQISSIVKHRRVFDPRLHAICRVQCRQKGTTGLAKTPGCERETWE